MRAYSGRSCRGCSLRVRTGRAEPEASMTAIFISHSSADQRVAREVAERLAARGFESVFLDVLPEGGLMPGVDWERELYRKLRRCRALIALSSEHSLHSQWCFAEVAQARAIPPALGSVGAECAPETPAGHRSRLGSGRRVPTIVSRPRARGDSRGELGCQAASLSRAIVLRRGGSRDLLWPRTVDRRWPFATGYLATGGYVALVDPTRGFWLRKIFLAAGGVLAATARRRTILD